MKLSKHTTVMLTNIGNPVKKFCYQRQRRQVDTWHYKIHEEIVPFHTQLFLRNSYNFENLNDSPCNLRS